MGLFTGVSKVAETIGDIAGKFGVDKTKKAEFEAEIKKAVLSDLRNARELQAIRLQSEDTFIRRFVPFFAIFLVISVMIITISLIFVTVPDHNHDILSLVLGSLVGSLGTVIAFYFGKNK